MTDPASEPAAPAVPALSRITTSFDADEDRVLLCGQPEHGEVLVLALTQRLLCRLLPHLWAWLQPGGGGSPAEALYRDALQQFAQQAAQAQMTPQAPVQPAVGASARLIVSIDVDHFDQALSICFKDRQGALARLVLGADSLRQWLIVLRGCWLNAAWPLDFWPDWLAEPGSAPVAGTPALH